MIKHTMFKEPHIIFLRKDDLFKVIGKETAMHKSTTRSSRRSTWTIIGNVCGLLLLLSWLTIVTELVLRRSRPDTKYGRYAPWHHPRPGIGRLLDLVGNGRVIRKICDYLPVVAFLSDITNAVYVNYIVETQLLEPLVPVGLELQRLGIEGRYAMFSFV